VRISSKLLVASRTCSLKVVVRLGELDADLGEALLAGRGSSAPWRRKSSRVL
jgi:hypothetical protein